jgi:hypothetical protein
MDKTEQQGLSTQQDEEANELDPGEAPIEPYFLTQEQVTDLDFASLPAALCWASYSANNWAMDFAAGAVDVAAWMGEEQRRGSNADDLPRALLIAKCCRPLEPVEVGIQPEVHGATFVRGVWSCSPIARAVTCVECRPDGKKALHLCVRGTDFANHPNKLAAVAIAIVGYFAWTYARIEKHSSGFKPLAKALSQYASNPNHGISEVILSGHSLGGAATQSLMPCFAACPLEVHLVTFGSPGSGSGWLGWLSWAIRLIRKGLRLGLRAIARRVAWPKLNRWLEDAAGYFVNPLPKKIGRRDHYKHPNDPIAKYAAMLYRRAGNETTALSSLEIPTDGGDTLRLKVSGLGAHACSKYFHRIHDMLDRALEDVAPYAEHTLARKRLAAARSQACDLEAQTQPELMNDRVNLARQANMLSLGLLPHSGEAKARLAQLPPATSAVSKIQEGRRLRRLVAKLTAAG